MYLQQTIINSLKIFATLLSGRQHYFLFWNNLINNWLKYSSARMCSASASFGELPKRVALSAYQCKWSKIRNQGNTIVIATPRPRVLRY